jgi:hypothetical protein
MRPNAGREALRGDGTRFPFAARSRRALGDTRGGSYIEYLIVIGVVAIAAQLGWRKFGSTVSTVTTRQADQVAIVGAVDYGCVGTLCLPPGAGGGNSGTNP